jgi:hypothetical protein
MCLLVSVGEAPAALSAVVFVRWWLHSTRLQQRFLGFGFFRQSGYTMSGVVSNRPEVLRTVLIAAALSGRGPQAIQPQEMQDNPNKQAAAYR